MFYFPFFFNKYTIPYKNDFFTFKIYSINYLKYSHKTWQISIQLRCVTWKSSLNKIKDVNKHVLPYWWCRWSCRFPICSDVLFATVEASSLTLKIYIRILNYISLHWFLQQPSLIKTLVDQNGAISGIAKCISTCFCSIRTTEIGWLYDA